MHRPSSFALAAGALIAIAVQPASAASLQDELQNLLQSHPGILAADKNVGVAQKEIERANSGYYPRIDLVGDMGPEIVDSPAERTAGNTDEIRKRQVAGVAIREHLFNGFLTPSQVKLAEVGKAGSEFQFSSQTQQFLFEGVSAYVNVLRQMRLIELALGNEENIKHQLSLEDERVRRGAGIAVDVLQAKARLQFAKERRVAFEGQLQDAISTYKQVFGHAPDLAAMMDPMPPVDVLPETVDQALDIASKENPVLQNAATAVEGARLRKDVVRADYFPTIDLVGTWNYEKDKNAVVGVRRDYALLVQAQWNLFNGFATQAGEARAALEHAASKDTRLLTNRRIEEQTRVAWQKLLTTRERVGLLENAVNLAAEVYDARNKLREAGKETSINVLDAENEVYTRRIDYTSASYDERLAVYQVLLAIGRLGPSYLGLQEG